ncbi:MAG: RsmB/NOP family class I SAM-dependent RNA methyltransferase [Deltaproteobacteria bacterium]|nr:RsmB/NOP family class I SAM-dependent RNA methyltransferase [Deltaproteobacteria bacterium]
MDLFCEYADIIPDFPLFQASLRKPLPVHLRFNSLKIDPDALLFLLEEEGVQLEQSLPWTDTLFLARNLDSPGNLLEYFLGYIHPQALTSCLPPLVLDPAPGSFVLDMCASPGGKTSQLAQLMENSGIIIANELFWTRHVPLAHTLARLGVLNAVITAYQAQEFPLRNRFDYVLADVPCSGEGRFRSTGREVFHRLGKKEKKLPEVQKRILLRGFDLLRPGGEMVYSTCTYNPEENEAMVDFLLKNRDAALLPIHLDLPGEPGIEEWKGKRYEKDVRYAVRLYPHRVDSVGFFMARIGRKA